VASQTFLVASETYLFAPKSASNFSEADLAAWATFPRLPRTKFGGSVGGLGNVPAAPKSASNFSEADLAGVEYISEATKNVFEAT
jgi:hypothetical protein